MILKVLVADDSILYRRVIAEALSSLPGVEVIGSVSNGRQALLKVRELKPDLLTLDMEMPEMDGLAVLDALRQSGEKTSVIVVSALTRHGGELTMSALEKGAFDFITKPDTINAAQGREAIQRELAPRVRAVANRLEVRNLLRNKPAAGMPATTAAAPGARASNLEGVMGRMSRLATNRKVEMVLIGVSTGGPNALARMMPMLPANLGVPVLVVQHMPPIFTQTLAESLSSKCAIKVREASNGEVPQPNTAYIAPGGKQMRVSPGVDGRSKVLLITDDPPENNCRPAVDYLFRSASQSFPGQSVAVILTGMGSDGTLGLRLLKRQGCFVIGQDEASCVVYGMPKAAFDAGVVDAVLPLDNIAARITQAVRGGAA